LRFIVNKDKLAAELSALQGIAERKGALPILSHVHIVSDGQRLRMTATSRQTTLSTSLTAERVEEPGAICLPARRLYEVVRLMPTSQLEVVTDGRHFAEIRPPQETAKTRKGKSNFRMPGMDAAGWPQTPAPPEGAEWTDVPASLLRGVLKGVDYAIAPEEDGGKFNLKGVKLEVDGSTVAMTAAAGHRLAHAEQPLDVLTVADVDVLVPQEATDDLSRLLGDGEEPVGITPGENHLFFRSADRTLSATLLVGDFPNYQGILEGIKYPHGAEFPAELLSGALRRTLLAADGKSAAVKLTFKDGQLHLRAQTAESGEADESLESDWTGDPAKVWCNARYLLEFLAGVGDGTCRWEMMGELNPLHLVGSREGFKVRYVVMPLDIPEA
jgi:DNA polymerase-3 subunit beta